MDHTYEQNALLLVGGKFVNSGEDSCIYLDGPVGCVSNTLVVADPSYDPNDKSLVSRIIPKNGKEFVNQMNVRKAIDRLDLKYPGLRFREHFNVAVATCTPLMTKEDLKSDLIPSYCDATLLPDKALRSTGPKFNYTNFITTRQGPNLRDAYKEPKVYFRKAFFELMNTTVALNCEEILHYDLHSGNIAWTTDPFPKKTLVLFDWGRCVLDYNDFLKKLVEDEKFFKSRENLSQYNFQKAILNKLIGTQSYKQYIAEHARRDKSHLSKLEKLFFAWDTFSLLHFLATKKIPGMEDFASEISGNNAKKLGKNAGETGRLLIENAILTAQIPTDSNGKGKILFRDYLWGIIANLFKQKPVYQQGNLYVSTYTTGTLSDASNTIIEPEEFAPEALEDSDGTWPDSSSHSRSKSRSIIDLISMSRSRSKPLTPCSPGKFRHPVTKRCVNKWSPSLFVQKKMQEKYQEKQQSIIDLISMSKSSKKSPQKKKKSLKKKSGAKKSNSPCSPGKVRDIRTKRCRERKKPGPRPKSSCPKGKVRDKKSKRCRSSRR